MATRRDVLKYLPVAGIAGSLPARAARSAEFDDCEFYAGRLCHALETKHGKKFHINIDDEGRFVMLFRNPIG